MAVHIITGSHCLSRIDVWYSIAKKTDFPKFHTLIDLEAA